MNITIREPGSALTHFIAMVPETGTPNICPARTLDVEEQPPMTAARAP